jgi:uncharacterized protein (DUF427 family)
MLKEISVHKATGTWVVRTDNSVLGESRKALELIEGALPPVIYFPREDIGMAFLEPSDKTTTCPKKGVASYFHLVGRSGQVDNVAWTYETPNADAASIAGYLAFTPGTVHVEKL